MEAVSLTTDTWTSNAVPSERIFSATGVLVNKLRNRLASSVVDHAIFLNTNYVPEQADTQ